MEINKDQLADMQDNEDMNISVSGMYATVTYKCGKGKSTKTMPITKLIDFMTTSTKTTREFSFHPSGLRFVGNTGTKIMVAYEMPERAAMMKFRGYCSNNNGNEEFQSVFPWGVTFVELTDSPNGMHPSMFFQFALKGPITAMTDMMYVWPGSNVYPDHHCCMGGINVAPMKTIFETGDMPFLFYNGVSNHDLESGKFTAKPGIGGDRPYDLYKSLKIVEGTPQKPFPYDVLKNAMSLKSFLETRGFKNAK